MTIIKCRLLFSGQKCDAEGWASGRLTEGSSTLKGRRLLNVVFYFPDEYEMLEVWRMDFFLYIRCECFAHRLPSVQGVHTGGCSGPPIKLYKCEVEQLRISILSPNVFLSGDHVRCIFYPHTDKSTQGQCDAQTFIEVRSWIQIRDQYHTHHATQWSTTQQYWYHMVPGVLSVV